MNLKDQIAANLSESQQQALELDGHALIAAGAGAGKTETLTSLICRDLVVDQIPAERILVCTFTRAAAANLINRISLRLSDLDQDVDLSEMWIGTIDAICSRLLRQAALSAGISPGFHVADERELWPLQQQTMIEALGRRSIDDLHLISLLGDGDRPSFQKLLVESVDRLRQGGADPLNLDLPRPGQVDDQGLIERIDALLEEASLLSEGTAKRIRSRLEADRQGLTMADASIMTQPNDYKFGRPLKGKEELWDELDYLSQDLIAARLVLADQASYPVRQALATLLADYQREMNLIKEREELLDLTDLALIAGKLLSQGDIVGIERLYLDEAQDTNPRQLAILSALAASNFQISVGDLNQSIYSFRSADVEAFRQQKRDADSEVRLEENYRSAPEIINFINQLSNRIPELAEELVEMKPGHDNYDHPGEVELLTLTNEDNHHPPPPFEEATAALPLIEGMRQRLGIDYRDIAVLCRVNSVAEAYADALRQAGLPVLLIQKRGLAGREECRDLIAYLRLLDEPTDDEALLRVLSSPFVACDDSQIITICQQRQNKDQPLLPFAKRALPRFAHCYDQLRQQMHLLRPSQLAQETLNRSGVDIVLDMIDNTGAKRRNIEKLIRSITLVERSFDGVSLNTILQRFENEELAGIDQGQDATLPDDLNAIRIMTIHQAKGDEFPLTVFANLSHGTRNNSETIMITPEAEIGLVINSVTDSIADKEKERRKNSQADEERRIAYVAMTRAEKGLIMTASCGLKKNGSASWPGLSRWLIGDTLKLEVPPDRGQDQRVAVGQSSLLVRGLDPEKVSAIDVERPLEQIVIDFDQQGDSFHLAPARGMISYTRLSSWRRCSLRRHLEQDIDLNLETREQDLPTISGQSSGGLARGRMVHTLLSEVNWNDSQSLTNLIDSVEDDSISQILIDLDQSQLRQRLLTSKIIGIEREFSLRLNNYLISGVIDLLAEDEGNLLLIDWKTGEDLTDFAEDYQLQRSLYALALLNSQRFTDQTIEAYWLALEQESELDLAPATIITADMKDLLSAEVSDQIGQILAQPISPASNLRQPFCSGCPGLTRICPVSQTS